MFVPVELPRVLVMRQWRWYAKSALANEMPKLFRKCYGSVEKIRWGLARSMSTEAAVKFYANILKNESNASAVSERFVKEVLGLEDHDNIKMISKIINEKEYKVIDKITETHWKNYLLNKRYIKLDEGLKELKPIYETLQKESKTVQKFGYRLLRDCDIKDWKKIEQLLADADFIAEINKIKSLNEIPVIAKNVAKSLWKSTVVDVTAIDACKDIIKKWWATTKPIKWAPEATAELLESQKKINQLITDDINAINKRLTDPTAPDFVKKTDPLYDVYDQQIKTLDKFRGEVKTFDAIEAEHFINLRMDYNFKTQYIIELHEIRKTSAFESAYEEALKKAGKAAGEEDFEIMVKVVKQLKWENRPGLIITEKLIESLEKEIRPAVKFLKSADEFFLLLKGVLRPVSKVLKWV